MIGLAAAGRWSATLCAQAAYVTATGGDTTNDIPGYRVHMYTNAGSGTFEVSAGGDVEVLVVAGGGGGGRFAGGGGAGGVIFSNAVAVVVGSNYTVTVGAGGTGSTANYVVGGTGGDSVFGSPESSGVSWLP